ncbi:MAG: hypothetical protein IJG45_03615 [Oscillospiraceae bacterium]|nr:hypothetical protein [Oscillospiraceae bacterium]
MKKAIAILLAAALIAALLLAVSAEGEPNAAITVSPLSQSEFHKGDVVQIPTYSVEGVSEYTADVLLLTPNAEIFFLSHEKNGSITYYANNTNLYRASFCVSDTSFRAEMKGEYTLRYVVYDKEYNRTVTEVAFTVD